MALTVGELKEWLDEWDDDVEVRFASQPSWPFEYSIEQYVPCIVNQGKGDPELIMYLVEGRQIGYLPEEAKDEIGW